MGFKARQSRRTVDEPAPLTRVEADDLMAGIRGDKSVHFFVDYAFHKAMRVAAVQRGQTMKAFIIEAVRKELNVPATDGVDRLAEELGAHEVQKLIPLIKENLSATLSNAEVVTELMRRFGSS